MSKIILVFLVFFSSTAFSQSKAQLVNLKLGMKNAGVIHLDETNETSTFVKKKVGLGVLYSLLLPGMGELYGGDYSTGKYFTILEAVSWISYFGLQFYSDEMRKNYQDYAVENAGVTLNGKNDSYWANIGVYLNIDNYNSTMDLQWQFDKVYPRDSFYWYWNSNSDRKTYRDMWVASERAKTSLNYVAGVMVLNRLVSAINAVRVIKKHNKQIEVNTSFNINFGIESVAGVPEGIKLNLIKRF